MPRPLLVLLLPRPLERFLLRDQAEDLLRMPGAVAVSPPPRVPYGAFGRLPPPASRALARVLAARIALDGEARAIVIFHPLQLPLAEALRARHPGAELWYGRWDRYEEAYDAGPALKRRLAVLHARAVERAAFVFAVSQALVEQDPGAALVALAADSFPAPDPDRAVVAISLGHLGHRTDWRLLREVAERMPELVLLLVGEWHDDECGHDPDYRWCRAAPGLVWLGRRNDEEAARLILCATAGIVPFERSSFNDAGLPYRILKYARLGRPTVSPPLAGVRTWDRAVTTAAAPDEWVAALRAARPDPALRAWALEQTAERQNAPLWERARALGLTGS